MTNLSMFGCADLAHFVEGIEESATFQASGPGAVILSILSDAQDLAEHGHADESRQAINRAKYLVDKYLPAKR